MLKRVLNFCYFEIKVLPNKCLHIAVVLSRVKRNYTRTKK